MLQYRKVNKSVTKSHTDIISCLDSAPPGPLLLHHPRVLITFVFSRNVNFMLLFESTLV